jgi:predicted permease
MRNPLIKLKAPIVFGGLPFIILVLVPTTAIKMLSNPPTFLAEQMGAETVAMLKALFGKAINISFSSSSIVAFICGIVLFGFGFYYSSQRRAIKRKIKAEKREQMQSGGLY